MNPILELNDIQFIRDHTPILRDINWKVEAGQHWALLGANGSGKTTLLKVIAGYEWVTEGTVTVMGRRFGEASIPELRTHIGWVTSAHLHRFHGRDSALEVAVSGFDASIGLYREFSAEEYEAASEALRRTGAEDIAGRRWEVLSQGERQRVLIARALVDQPALLILDEPCAGLDPVAREDFLDDVERLAARDPAPTILLVTHHVEELGGFLTHALAMNEGRVYAEGAVERVVTSEVVSRIFGKRCEVRKEGEAYRLRVVS